jgi:hypothetical protein
VGQCQAEGYLKKTVLRPWQPKNGFFSHFREKCKAIFCESGKRKQNFMSATKSRLFEAAPPPTQRGGIAFLKSLLRKRLTGVPFSFIFVGSLKECH